MSVSASTGFIENQGQVDEEVLYYASLLGATVYLTRDALVFDLQIQEPEHSSSPRQPWERTIDDIGAHLSLAGNASFDEMRDSAVRRGCAVWACFDGAEAPTQIEARGELSGRHNYFLGNEPAAWRANVPSYEEVSYYDLWPGISLVFRIRGQALVYEVNAADTDRSAAAAFRYKGAEKIIEQGHAATWVETTAGRLIHQWMGSGQGRFMLAGETATGDPESAGRDDPSVLLWSTFLGGSGSDGDFGESETHGLALDSEGNAIITGYTTSSDFPTTPGAYEESYNGERDAFISKLSFDGSSLIWSTYLGGSDLEKGFGVVVDSDDNPIALGYTYSPDFPTTPGAYDEEYNEEFGSDAFVAKISPSGDALIWSTFLGGSANDVGLALTLGSSENLLITGHTSSEDFPTTPGAYEQDHGGNSDAFVLELSATGSSLVWSTFLGGVSCDRGVAIVCDSLDNPVLTGYTHSSDFPVTSGAYDTTHEDGRDVFVSKLSSSGSTLLWSTFLGGSDAEQSNALTLDSDVNPLVIGYTRSTDFPATSGAYADTICGPSDAFVTKLSSSGAELQWSTFLGGGSSEWGVTIALNCQEDVVVAGETESSDFPIVGGYDESFNGNGDGFVTVLSATGSDVLWSTFLGGSGQEFPHGIALDSLGDPVVMGTTHSADFPTTQGAYDESYNGSHDVFISKLDLPSPHATVVLIHGINGNPDSWGGSDPPNLQSLLENEGYTVRQYQYATGLGHYDESIDDLAATFAESLTAWSDTLHFAEFGVRIIAHSMGGLISRYLLAHPVQFPVGEHVRSLITLGTPNYGAATALWFPDLPFFLQGTQQKFGSDFLWNLHEAWSLTAPNTSVLAICGARDYQVPHDGMVLLPSANLDFPGVITSYIPNEHRGPGGMADIQSADHPAYLALLPFLSGETPPTNEGSVEQFDEGILTLALKNPEGERVHVATFLGWPQVYWRPNPTLYWRFFWHGWFGFLGHGVNEESGIYYGTGADAGDYRLNIHPVGGYRAIWRHLLTIGPRLTTAVELTVYPADAMATREVPPGDPDPIQFGDTGVTMDFDETPGGEVTVFRYDGEILDAMHILLPHYWESETEMLRDSVLVTIHLEYDESDVHDAGLAEGDLQAVRYDSSWVVVSSLVDTVANVVSTIASDLPLFSLGIQDPASVDESSRDRGPEGPRQLSLQIRPNPVLGSPIFMYLGSPVGIGPYRLDVMDVTGRCVRRLSFGVDTGEGRIIRWDGRGSSGVRVPPGIYYVRLKAGGRSVTKHLTVVR
jgi:hypothetical protein